LDAGFTLSDDRMRATRFASQEGAKKVEARASFCIALQS